MLMGKQRVGEKWVCVHASVCIQKKTLNSFTPEHTEEIFFQAPRVRTWPGSSLGQPSDYQIGGKLVGVGFVSGTGVGQVGGDGS